MIAFGLYAAALWFGWIEGPWFLGAIIALLVSLVVVFVMPDRPRR